MEGQLPWQWITGPVAALALSVLANVALWRDNQALRAENKQLQDDYTTFMQALIAKAGGGNAAD